MKINRVLWILIALALVLVCVLSACSAGAETLSDAQREEIEKAYLEKYGDDMIGEYYGTFGGYIILMDAGDLTIVTEQDIGGRVFKWGSGSLILNAYKDGQIYDLKEVYEAGGITEKDLDKILEKHKDHFAAHHNWDYDAEG